MRHRHYANALAFNANETGGKAVLALALAAKASGDLVTAYGTGPARPTAPTSKIGNMAKLNNLGIVEAFD